MYGWANALNLCKKELVFFYNVTKFYTILMNKKPGLSSSDYNDLDCHETELNESLISSFSIQIQ